MASSLVQTFHGAIKCPDKSTHTSGGSLLSTRFKVSDEQNIFFASQNQIYHSKVPDIPETAVEWKRGRQGENISLQVALGDLPATPLLPFDLHQTEIQSIAVAPDTDGVRVAGIDSVGTMSLLTLPNLESPLEGTRRQVLGSSKKDRDAGWAGVALHPSLNKVWATTFWDKELRLYEDGELIRSVNCCLTPQAIKYVEMKGGNTVALAESNVVSLWDLRASERNGCVHRLQPSPCDIFCIDAVGDVMAVAGEDKTIYIYDLRKTKIMGQWTKALKYQVLSVFLSSIDQSVCYATGLDHEIFCGTWEKTASNLGTLERRGFRGSSRWIGLDRVPGTDTLVGLTDTLHLYKLRYPYRLNPACATLPLPREASKKKQRRELPPASSEEQ